MIRTPAAGASNVLPLLREYKAFDAPTGDKQEGFVIQTSRYGKLITSFGIFFQSHLDDAGENMVLLFAHQHIRFRGELLDELAEPLRLKTLEAMREFDGRKHLAADPGACVITGIEVFSKMDSPEEK